MQNIARHSIAPMASPSFCFELKISPIDNGREMGENRNTDYNFRQVRNGFDIVLLFGVAVVFEVTRYIIKLYHHRQHRKYTVRDSIKGVVWREEIKE